MSSTFTQQSEPSYFYFLMAKTCFRRATTTPHPKAGSTLRALGRDYLAKSVTAPLAHSHTGNTTH
jgi:hypothetical protein